MALYTCKKCGKKVPTQYEVCPFCKTPKPTTVEYEQPLDPKKIKQCKTCGAVIAKSAKVCPKCGEKQKKKHPIFGTLLIVLGVIMVVSVIGGNSGDEPKKVGDTSSTQSKADMTDTNKDSNEQTVFGVGEQVSLNDVVVTLISVTENGGKEFFTPEAGKVFALCEFEIENNSTKDITVSSIMSFEAYVDDYSISMSIAATTGSSKNQLDGSVAAGKKMNGVIGYEVPEDWSEIEIKFTPDFWSQKDITFVYNK